MEKGSYNKGAKTQRGRQKDFNAEDAERRGGTQGEKDRNQKAGRKSRRNGVATKGHKEHRDTNHRWTRMDTDFYRRKRRRRSRVETEKEQGYAETTAKRGIRKKRMLGQ